MFIVRPALTPTLPMLLSFLLLLFSYLQPPRQVFCYGLSCNWAPILTMKMKQQLGYQISVGLWEKERRQRGRERPERRRCLPTIAIARAPSFSSRAGAAAVTGGLPFQVPKSCFPLSDIFGPRYNKTTFQVATFSLPLLEILGPRYHETAFQVPMFSLPPSDIFGSRSNKTAFQVPTFSLPRSDILRPRYNKTALQVPTPSLHIFRYFGISI